MKQTILLTFSILLLSSACLGQNRNPNTFSSSDDTLFIQTQKIKGDSLFSLGATDPNFRDTNEWKNLDWFKFYPDYKIVYPSYIKDLQLGFVSLMFDSLKFFDINTKHILKQKNFQLADRYIIQIKGSINGKEVFIVDQNNNKDLTDDTIREFSDWNWKSSANLIPVYYNVDYGKKVIRETGWYKIGISRGQLLNSSSQCLISQITIANKQYTIGVTDDNVTTFDFIRPIMYLFGENGVTRDTLIKGEIVELNKYIKLGGTYYKFDKLYNGSGTVILTKEKNFNNLVGNQIGMIAASPDFTAINGKKYNCKDLSKKPILIANISGCTRKSYDDYKKIIEKYSDKLAIIGVENTIKQDIGGIMVDIADSINNDFYLAYRNTYSSYDCYIISKEKRIIDKFELWDWEKAIKKHFNK